MVTLSSPIRLAPDWLTSWWVLGHSLEVAGALQHEHERWFRLGVEYAAYAHGLGRKP